MFHGRVADGGGSGSAARTADRAGGGVGGGVAIRGPCRSCEEPPAGVEQGERLVAEAESTYLAAVAELAHAMGSPQLAAAMLDVKPAVVRKAVVGGTTLRIASGAKAPAVRRLGSVPAPSVTVAS